MTETAISLSTRGHFRILKSGHFNFLLTGETETRHGYTSADGRRFVKVDCETSTTVYEGGLDKRSSLDSLQQALFFSVLTGKRPAVVIYDTDGRE